MSKELIKQYVKLCADLRIVKLTMKKGGETQVLLEKEEWLLDDIETVKFVMSSSGVDVKVKDLNGQINQLVLSKTGYSIKEITSILASNEDGDKTLQNRGTLSVRREPTKIIERTKWDLMMDEFDTFCRYGLKIVYRPGLNPDYPHGGSGPFILNEHQLRIAAVIIDTWIDGKPVRAQILKARQMGITTVLLAFWVWMIVQEDNFKVIFVIDALKHMYTKRSLVIGWLEHLAEHFDDAPVIEKRGGSYIELSNKAAFFFDSAEGVNPGTSEFVNGVYFSEQSKWKSGKVDTITTSLIPSLPTIKGTFFINESTAHGVEDFHESWQRIKNGEEHGSTKTMAVFIPWYLSGEYKTDVPNSCYRHDGSFIYLNSDLEVGEQNTLGESLHTEESYSKWYKLSSEQTYWRRLKIKNDFKGDRRKFDQEYPTTDEHAFAGAGTLWFGSDVAKLCKERAISPIVKCRISSEGDIEDPSSIKSSQAYKPQLSKDETGGLWIYSFPVSGKKYVIGGDVAEGITTSRGGKQDPDSSVAIVLDEDTGELVAAYEGKIKPEHFAFKLVLLGNLFNKAKVNTERNSVGEAVWGVFKQTGYPNVHLRRSGYYDDVAWEKLNQSNRLTYLVDLAAFVRRSTHLVRDKRLANQISKFIRNNKGKPEAMSGEHDDFVLAYMHAYLMIYKTKGIKFKPPEEEEDKRPGPLDFSSIIDEMGLEERPNTWSEEW